MINRIHTVPRQELEVIAIQLLHACKTARTAATEIFHGDVMTEQERVVKIISNAIEKAEED